MIKKWLSKIADPDRDVSERTFRLISTFGIIALAITFMFGLFIGESVQALGMLAIALILLGAVSFYSLRSGRTDLGAGIIAFFILLVILPVTFITSGGMYGGTPVWFVFCAVYICISVRGRLIAVYLVIETVVAAVCYYIAWAYPDFLVQHTSDAAYLDSFSGVIIVSFLVCMLIFFQRLLYKQENEKARLRQKEIEELNRAQNLFFSSMSHEIRTPINTIIGLNEMILREDISDEVADDARNIQGASKMLLTIINDLLDMSKLESGKMEIVSVKYNVGDMLSEIVAMIWQRAKEKGLEFHVDIDPTIPVMLYGDEVRIKQVIINLLNNAVKYTQEGGVTLSMRAKPDGQNQALLTIAVTDTGMGIKKDSIPILFDAFKRVDEEKNRHIEGTGLGLSIVKQIVDLMDGNITVSSVYTKGSTFTVNLPQGIVDASWLGEINLDRKHSLHEREHYRQSFEAPEAKLLIVDDNEVNLNVEEKLLRDTKINIDTATSGSECLKLSLINKYDVIFMDHLMPEMNGIECLNALRAQQGGLNRNTPVIVLTANAGSENQALYSKSGFDDYLSKPVSGADMERILIKTLPREIVNLTDMSIIEGDDEGVISEHKMWVPVRITTDSVCDLPENIINKYNISVFSYRVHTTHGVFLDNEEIETDEVLAYLDDLEVQARSEAPGVKDYERFFASQLSDARHIIHISMAKNASNGYGNAKEAATSFDNVTVIDSGHLSSGMGLLVMYAAKLVEKDMSIDEMVKRIKNRRKNIKTSFVVDNTSYLARSGRINTKVDNLCKVLMLHPMIVMKGSSMKVGTIISGNREAMRKRYIDKVLRRRQTIDAETVFITYTGMPKDELDSISESIKKKINAKTIVCQKASSAISINCGPGSFGVIYNVEGREL